MAKKKDDKPALTISRNCMVCGKVFALGHPNSPHLMCEKCERLLAEMISERINERHDNSK